MEEKQTQISRSSLIHKHTEFCCGAGEDDAQTARSKPEPILACAYTCRTLRRRLRRRRVSGTIATQFKQVEVETA
jgi:hypothetical protein